MYDFCRYFPLFFRSSIWGNALKRLEHDILFEKKISNYKKNNKIGQIPMPLKDTYEPHPYEAPARTHVMPQRSHLTSPPSKVFPSSLATLHPFCRYTSSSFDRLTCQSLLAGYPCPASDNSDPGEGYAKHCLQTASGKDRIPSLTHIKCSLPSLWLSTGQSHLFPFLFRYLLQKMIFI